MYGLFVELEIDADRAEEAIGFLTGVAVPMISQGAGFASGTWMRSLDGLHTRSLILSTTRFPRMPPRNEPVRARLRAPRRGSCPPRSSR
jgi:hypothetical protein